MIIEGEDILRGFFDGLRPEPLISVSEWADRYRYLSPVAAAESGLYRTSKTPYMREIMDKLSSYDPCERVVFMKSAQCGATEAGNNWIGYIVDIAPASTLMVMPTEEMAKRNSKMRIDTMVDASPRLRDKIKRAKSRDSENTVLQKGFPGGVMIMTGANSPSGLRSMPIKNLFLDEVDGYPLSAGDEGSPVELAIARTRTFAKKKIFLCSTPTVSGESVIESRFLETDQKYFYVPCPHCQKKQRLVFESLKWDDGKPETVLYYCEHCGAGIEERYKPFMLEEGAWVATKPENMRDDVTGFHINALYAPLGWYSWKDIVEEYLKSKNDVPRLKTFVNTVLGETWSEQGEAPAWENLYNRRELYETNKPSKDVVFLTAGVDVQKDRLELEIVGWCKGKVSYSVDYRVLLGETSSKAVWNELAAVVNEQWTREDGVLLPLRMMAVDTGYNTSHVYEFCRRFEQSRVVPVKGQDSQSTIITPPRAVDTARNGKKINGLKIWHVGVSIVKSETYGYLKVENNEGEVQDGYCHFPQYDQHYFKGLTAEQLEFKVIRGFRKYQWVKKYDRNEPLDCRVYARAAASVVGIDRMTPEAFEQMRNGYDSAPRGGVQKKKRESSIW